MISQHALLTLCTQFKLGELVQTHTMKGALSPSSYSSLLDSDLRPGGPSRSRTTHLIMNMIIGGIHALLLGMAQAHGRTMPGRTSWVPGCTARHGRTALVTAYFMSIHA